MELFDESPATAHSPPPTGHDDMQDEGLGSDQSSSLEQSSLSSTNHSEIDDISARVQHMVAKINDHRANDQKAMESFQETLAYKVTEFCQQIKEHMYAVYEDNSCDMQTKLEELSGILERCSQLNDDLLGAGNALKGLSQGLALSLTPEQ